MVAATAAVLVVKKAWPGFPLSEDQIELLGGALVGGHVFTDIASFFRRS